MRYIIYGAMEKAGGSHFRSRSFSIFLADDVLEPCVWVWVSVSLEEANGSYSFGELLMWVLGFIFYLIFIALRRSINNYIYNEGENYIKLNKT